MPRVLITQTSIVAQAYVWLAIPTVIWLVCWLRPWIGIPVAAALVAALAGVLLRMRRPAYFRTAGWHDVTVDGRYAAIAAVLLLYVVFSGIGGFWFQMSDDAVYRNAMYYELVTQPWPVTYPDTGSSSYLCYFMGFWLLPALLAKLCGGSLAVGNVAQVLYAYWGLMIVFNFLYSRFRGRAGWLILVVFLFFSAWDLALRVLFHGNPGLHAAFLRSDQDLSASYFATNDVYILFSGNYNSALPAFIAYMLLWHTRRHVGVYLFAFSLMFICAPFASAGMLLLAAYHLIRHFRAAVTWQNVTGLIIFLLESSYYVSNHNSGFSPGGATRMAEVAWSAVGFLFFSYAIFLPWIWKSVRKDAAFRMLLATTLLFAFMGSSGAPDLAWRGSIPFSFYFLVHVIGAVAGIRNWRTASHRLFAAVLLAGSVSPVCYYIFTMSYPALHAAGRDDVLRSIEAWNHRGRYEYRWKRTELEGKLHTEADDCYDNFFADGDSFFARCLMRKRTQR